MIATYDEKIAALRDMQIALNNLMQRFVPVGSPVKWRDGNNRVGTGTVVAHLCEEDTASHRMRVTDGLLSYEVRLQDILRAASDV